MARPTEDGTQSLRTARLFEFYVRVVWPLHRLLVRNRFSRRCRRCAASERMIPLDATDLCEVCRTGDPQPVGGSRRDEHLAVELEQILGQHQNAGTRQYDALCLFSGGKDSTYMIQRVHEQFPGLRVLAYTIDNGFMSPVARENVHELIGRLEVDHVFVRPDRRFYTTLFRYCLTHLNEDGGYGTLDFSDGEFMLDTARTIAAERQIPLILCGYSRYQVQNGLKLQHFESPREKERANRMATAGIPLAAVFPEADIQRWWRGGDWPEDRVARLLFPLYAWDLDEAQILSALSERGLLAAKQYSPIVTNHRLIPLIGVVDVHRSGYSSFEVEFCRMIRESRASRREWQHVFEFLEYTARSGLFVRELVIDLLSELDLTLDDVGVRFT